MLRSTCLPMPSNLMEPCSIHNGRSVDTHLNTFIKIPSCLLSPACRVCSLQSWESSPWYSWKVGWPSSALRVFPAAPRLTVTSSSFFLLCHSHSNFITLLGFILTRTICHNTKKKFSPHSFMWCFNIHHTLNVYFFFIFLILFFF